MFALFLGALAMNVIIDILTHTPINTMVIAYFTVFEWLPMLSYTPEEAYEDF